jgi:sulfur carrier protein
MSEASSITVEVNGEQVTTTGQARIPDLLRELGMNPDRVVVEWNGRAQTREESARTELGDGDRLEVVRLVAGG